MSVIGPDDAVAQLWSRPLLLQPATACDIVRHFATGESAASVAHAKQANQVSSQYREVRSR